MADTITANLGLQLQQIYPGDQWGNKLNSNFAAIDVFAGGSTELTGSRTFGTAAQVLADVALTYTPGTALTVVAGQYVLTQSEGVSYKVAASTATDQHVTTAGGVKLYVQPKANGYSLEEFGAVGDGVADDTAALQTAMAAAATNGGGEILFGPKTYAIGVLSAVPNNVQWQGVSGRTVVLLRTGIANGSTPIIQATVSSGLDVRSANGIAFRDIVFDGNRSEFSAWTTNRVFIFLAKVMQPTIERCTFRNFRGIAIAEQGCFGAKIQHNVFTGCARTDIEAPVILTNNWTPDGTYSVGTKIYKNIFQDNFFSAVYLNGQTGGEFSGNWCLNNGESTVFASTNPRDVTIRDNVIDGTVQYFSAAQGIEVQNIKNVTIDGNTIKNTARMGISVMNCFNFTVTNNKIIDCSLAISKSGTDEHQSAGILLATVGGVTCKSGVITGNVFQCTPDVGQKYCLSGNQSGTAISFERIVIQGNVFLNGFATSGYPVRWFNAARPESNIVYADNVDGITDTPARGFWAQNSRITRLASAGGHLFSVCTSSGYAFSATWTSGASYTAEQSVNVTGVAVYRCASPGGGASTVQPSVAFGFETTADGYTWQRLGAGAAFRTAAPIS